MPRWRGHRKGKLALALAFGNLFFLVNEKPTGPNRKHFPVSFKSLLLFSVSYITITANIFHPKLVLCAISFSLSSSPFSNAFQETDRDFHSPFARARARSHIWTERNNSLSLPVRPLSVTRKKSLASDANQAIITAFYYCESSYVRVVHFTCLSAISWLPLHFPQLFWRFVRAHSSHI